MLILKDDMKLAPGQA